MKASGVKNSIQHEEFRCKISRGSDLKVDALGVGVLAEAVLGREHVPVVVPRHV